MERSWRKRMSTSQRAGVVAVAALALSGCAGDPSPSVTPSPDPSSVPSASPSVTPGFVPDPAAATLGPAAPVALVKAGPTGLWLYDLEGHGVAQVDYSDAGVHGYMLTVDGDVSWDGNQVVFDSYAADIVPGDTNGCTDVFLRAGGGAGPVIRVSDWSGNQGDETAFEPRISADGTHVVFSWQATNAAPVGTVPQVYLYEIVTGDVFVVSEAPGGALVNGPSSQPSVSAGGRYVAFASTATNLLAGDNNNAGDIFVVDTETGAVERVSVASDGTQGDLASAEPTITLDGRYVAFSSEATTLVGDDANGRVDVFVHDRMTGRTWLVSRTPTGTPANGDSLQPVITQDGAGVVFTSSATNLLPGDTNGADDVYYVDLATGEITRLSLSPNGEEANGAFYIDAVYGARYVVAFTYATNVSDLPEEGVLKYFVYDLVTGETTRLR